MIVRRLRQEDLFDAGIVSHIAFHYRRDDIGAMRKEWEEHPEEEDWGAFSDDGQLMARIINNHIQCRLDGTVIRSGGIGAVSTLPEYRGAGAVRAIFESLLPEARKRGEVISTLYPFQHAFYRKFGYETLVYKNQFELTPAQLAGHTHAGWVRQWKPGDPVGEYTRVYERFAGGYNLAHLRDDGKMAQEHINGLFYKDRHFVYLLGTGEEASAYVDFQDEFRPEGARLVVKEAAWTSPEGFRSVLGFLARFTADYRSMELPTPTEMDLRLFVRDPYSVTMAPQCDHMVRVIHAEKLLALLSKPRGASFTVAVSGDAQLPENNGVWQVRGKSVTPFDGQPDLSVSVRALGQLAVGAISLAEAEYRGDVTVYGNRETLTKVFHRKPIYVGDHF